MARHAKNEWYPFWRTLKEGHDYFELTRQVPTVAVCNRRYVVNVSLAPADAAKLNPEAACPAFHRPAPSPFSPKPGEQVAAAQRGRARAKDAHGGKHRVGYAAFGPDQGAGRSPAWWNRMLSSIRSTLRQVMVQQPQRPRRRLKGSLVWRAWLAAAVLMIGIAAVLLSRDVMRDWDRLQIDAERARRLAYSVRGVPLPGTPDLDDLAGRLAAHGVALGAPVFMRIFKREFELELWLKRDDRFHRFAVYPICRWSGDLGPKLAQGD